MSAKVAIAPGGGGARGHATTAVLAAADRTVVAAGRSEQALRDLPGHVRAEAAATDPGRGGEAHRPDRRPGRPPGVLVSTIGAFRPADALTAAPETLRLMLDVNLGPALWLSQAAAPHTQRQGSGAIVHVGRPPQG